MYDMEINYTTYQEWGSKERQLREAEVEAGQDVELLGAGRPRFLTEAEEEHLFDYSLPARIARNGWGWQWGSPTGGGSAPPSCERPGTGRARRGGRP